jgi:hypothetical protein
MHQPAGRVETLLLIARTPSARGFNNHLGGVMGKMRMAGAVCALAAFVLAPIRADAASIEIKGDATACFGVGCSTFADNTSTTIGGVTLSYGSDGDWDFLGFTEDDILSIEGDTGNFGTLSVNTPDVKTTVSTAFTLLLTFINPISPAATFDAAIRGTVSVLANKGGIVVNFDPDVIEGLPISDSTGPLGTMSVTAFSLPIASGGSAELTGLVETQPVPVPGSLLLLATGAAGALFRRRKLSNV